MPASITETTTVTAAIAATTLTTTHGSSKHDFDYGYDYDYITGGSPWRRWRSSAIRESHGAVAHGDRLPVARWLPQRGGGSRLFMGPDARPAALAR